MALRAVKETKEHDESTADFTRQCDKSPVTMSAVTIAFSCLAARTPPDRGVTFQVSRPAFPPRTWPCVLSKRLRSTMNHTLTSADSVISPQSQQAQLPLRLCCLEAPTPPDRGVPFQVSRPAFPPETRPCVLSKRLRSTINPTLTSPGSVISPQLH
jgi:hypothetical protein